MKLRDARLCLDCDEIHQDGMCPGCGSESFAFVSRWVPAPEGERPPRTATSAEAEVFRALLKPPVPPPHRQLFRKGLLGLTALGLVGWAWRSSRPGAGQSPDVNEPPAPSGNG